MEQRWTRTLPLLVAAVLAGAPCIDLLAQGITSPWTRQTRQDRITDVVIRSATTIDMTGKGQLRVQCAGNVYSVEIAHEDLWPTSVRRYRVAYRIDDKPGVQGEVWSGEKGLVIVPRDRVGKVIADLLHGKLLLVRLPALDGSVDLEFPIEGFDEEFGAFPKECFNSLFTPPPTLEPRR